MSPFIGLTSVHLCSVINWRTSLASSALWAPSVRSFVVCPITVCQVACHVCLIFYLSKCDGDSGPGPLLLVWIWAVESGVWIKVICWFPRCRNEHTRPRPSMYWLWTHLGVWLAPSLMSVRNSTTYRSRVMKETQGAQTWMNDCWTSPRLFVK